MKKIIAMLLALVLTLSMLAGCTGAEKQKETNGPSSSPDDTPASAAAEDVTLDFYIWDELQAPAAKQMIESFHADHPNINVELTVIPWDQYIPKMQTVLANGTGPDICWLNTSLGTQYIPADSLVNLTPYVERDGYDVNGLNANIRDAYSYEGNLYAIPKDIDTVCVFYNKELFDRANVPYPSDDWTWDDFRETAKSLTIEGTQYGYSNNNDERVWYSLIMANGGSIFNEDHTKATVNNDVVINAIQFLKDMEIVDHSTPSGAEFIEAGEETFFISSMCAMEIYGSWGLATFAEALGDKLGIAEMPTGSAGKSSISHGIGYGITKGCQHVDEAWEFLKYLGSAEAQAYMATDVIPANADAVSEWAKQYPNYDLTPIERCLEYSPILPLAATNAASVREKFRAAIQEIWLDTSDVPTAIAKAETAMNEEIAK